MKRFGSGLARYQPNNGVRHTLPKGLYLIVMILPARDKPILSMLEWIRVRLITRLHTKRIGMEKYGGSVCSNVQDKLEKLKMESKSFSVMSSGNFKYEVDNDYERHVIDLTKKECTCRIWDLIGIPCKHGV
jgi:hypothetical protein